MRDFTIPAFILALPPLAALGHDIYMAYLNTDLPLDQRFYLSDLGWLWKEYSPDTYDWALQNTDELLWNNVIDPVLQGSALYVLGIPFAVFLVLIVIMKILGLGPYASSGLLTSLAMSGKRKKSGFSFDGGGSKGKMKYKRK